MLSHPPSRHEISLPPGYLLRVAKRLRAKSVKDAQGRCLHAAVRLAIEANSRGLRTASLLVWDLKGDADYRDHWAFGFESSTVIDVTRMQVDGRKGLVFHVGDYPASYGCPRSYPIHVLADLLHEYADADGDANRLSWFWMQRLRWIMCRYDAMHGVLCLQPIHALMAVRAYMAFTLQFALQRWKCCLHERLQLLNTRSDDIELRRCDATTRY